MLLILEMEEKVILNDDRKNIKSENENVLVIFLLVLCLIFVITWFGFCIYKTNFEIEQPDPIKDSIYYIGE